MSQQYSNDVLKHINEVDAMLSKSQDLLNKSQIVRGGNSERKEWAGSKWEDQEVRDIAPNGTDYEPEKAIKRATNKKPFAKSVDDLSNEDLEHELAMRKSGVPNIVAARQAILKGIPSAVDTTCESCNGYALNKSGAPCGSCDGFGFKFEVPKEDLAKAQSVISDVIDRYNIGEYPDMLSKAQKKNKGGGDFDADPTPAYAHDDTEEDEDFGSPNIAKGDIDSGMAEMQGELAKMKEICKGDFDGDDDDEDDEDWDDEDDDDDSSQMKFDMGKTKKSVKKSMLLAALDTVMSAQQMLLKSQRVLLAENESLRKGLKATYGLQKSLIEMSGLGLEMQGALLKSTVPAGVDLAKSQNRAPARAPRGGQRHIDVIEKSFLSDQGQGGQVDFATLKKATSHMLLENPNIAKSNQVTSQHLVGMDTGNLPEEKIVRRIEAYIQEKGFHTFQEK